MQRLIALLLCRDRNDKLTTHKAIVEAYIAGVLSGGIVAGHLVKLAVRRHVADLDHAGERGFYFDEAIAEEACSFFPNVLRHTSGAWDKQPFTLTPSQAFTVWCMFGWRRIADTFRRFRKSYIGVARKYGKTQMAAGLAILVMFADNPIEMGAEIYVAATKEDQANKTHREAIAMVESSHRGSLAKISTVNKKNISITKYRSFFRPLGSDSKTNASWNPHWAILDELCDWQERHRGLWGAMTTAMGARRQPMRLVTCTAGDDTSDIWQEEDDFAVKVLESVVTGQIIDDTYFAFVARIDDERPCDRCDGKGLIPVVENGMSWDEPCHDCKGTGLLPADDPMDESCWPKAQPNLGVTVQWDYYREQANEAKHKPTAMHDFVRYQCNRKVTSSIKAISPEAWSRCNEPLTDWGGMQSYGAIDLGWEKDLASISIVCKVDEIGDADGKTAGVYEARSWSFICSETDRDLRREPFATFIRNGSLTVTDGSSTDIIGTVVPRIAEISEQYNVVQWAFDPNNARAVMNVLESQYGIEGFKFYQSHGMYNESLRAFLQAIKSRTLRHGGDPLLAWCAGNLTISKKGAEDLWMPDKRKSREKIDPIVALIMAMGGAMTAQVTSCWNPAIGV